MAQEVPEFRFLKSALNSQNSNSRNSCGKEQSIKGNLKFIDVFFCGEVICQIRGTNAEVVAAKTILLHL